MQYLTCIPSVYDRLFVNVSHARVLQHNDNLHRYTRRYLIPEDDVWGQLNNGRTRCEDDTLVRPQTHS